MPDLPYHQTRPSRVLFFLRPSAPQSVHPCTAVCVPRHPKQYFSAALSCFAEKPRAHLLRYASRFVRRSKPGPSGATPPASLAWSRARHPWRARSAARSSRFAILASLEVQPDHPWSGVRGLRRLPTGHSRQFCREQNWTAERSDAGPGARRGEPPGRGEQSSASPLAGPLAPVRPFAASRLTPVPGYQLSLREAVKVWPARGAAVLLCTSPEFSDINTGRNV
jgi:hypothetical protein